jgi:hypothetical protein
MEGRITDSIYDTEGTSRRSSSWEESGESYLELTTVAVPFSVAVAVLASFLPFGINFCFIFHHFL